MALNLAVRMSERNAIPTTEARILISLKERQISSFLQLRNFQRTIMASSVVQSRWLQPNAMPSGTRSLARRIEHPGGGLHLRNLQASVVPADCYVYRLFPILITSVERHTFQISNPSVEKLNELSSDRAYHSSLLAPPNPPNRALCFDDTIGTP